MSAPIGNQNAAKAKQWTAAIHRALAKRSRVDAKEALDELAEILLTKAQEGEGWALKELGDRIEGKPHQTIGGEGENGDIPVSMTVKYVKPTG